MTDASKSGVEQTKVITSGNTIRIETPKGSRHNKPNLAVIVREELSPIGGFVGFLRENAIVGLAIGFVVGTQIQGLVKQLITSFIDPLTGLLFGQRLNQDVFVINWHNRPTAFAWGAFVYELIDVLITLAAIYAIIKFLNLDKLDKPKEKK